MNDDRRMATPYYRATDKFNLVKIMAVSAALALFVGGMVGATVILAVIECT